MKNKDKILKVINKQSCGITIKWIFNFLWNKINKSTVYRNISKLLLEWYILEDFSNSWEKVYSIKGKHHHHFICNICNNSKSIGCILDLEIKKLEDKFWFIVNNHSLLLSWICNDCK